MTGLENCKVNKYCDFKVLLVNDEVQKEVCRFCNRIVLYRKVDGRVDNTRYMRDHVRAFAQPGTKIFNEVASAEDKAKFEQIKRQREGSEKKQADLSHEFKQMMKGGKRTIFT